MRTKERGFTLVELIIVMAVISVLISGIMPHLRGMQHESQLTKAEQELTTLKSAILSYWKNNNYLYPANIHAALMSASPNILKAVLDDPFDTDGPNKTYGYVTGNDSSYGDYFAVYTKGPLADTTPNWDSANKRFTYAGTGRVVSNAPVTKQ